MKYRVAMSRCGSAVVLGLGRLSLLCPLLDALLELGGCAPDGAGQARELLAPEEDEKDDDDNDEVGGAEEVCQDHGSPSRLDSIVVREDRALGLPGFPSTCSSFGAGGGAGFCPASA